ELAKRRVQVACVAGADDLRSDPAREIDTPGGGPLHRKGPEIPVVRVQRRAAVGVAGQRDLACPAASGRFRERGSDYLAYTLIDSAVDSYFHVLETIGDQLEAIEEELITRPSEELLQQIHQLRGQLVFVRKAAAPLRDLVGGLLLSDSPLIDDRTRIYLRDLHEHVIHVMDNIDNYRDTAKGLIDLSLSNMSHRTNEVMQFLTIIASVFIPLTFIAGVYGMNFAHMPELQWRYGYLLAIVLMLCCALAMLWFFKRKKWF
ncbi:MAG: magnesium/cobalt transporter CorA, partial [Pelovirga sp.]